MSLEQKLRDNLGAAANSLVVPEARPLPVRSGGTGWRHRAGYAISGAVAALVLIIVPALLLGRREPSEIDTATPTATDSVVDTTAEPYVAPTASAPGTTIGFEEEHVLGEASTPTHLFTVKAGRSEETEPSTAVVMLGASTLDGEPVDQTVVGEASGFFWHSVTGPGGLCLLSASPTPDGASVAVQLLLSSSMGCSEPYLFELGGGLLGPKDTSPEDVARLFVEAWQGGATAAFAGLATPEASDQAAALPPPVEMRFGGCEGAAGSVYCTWEGAGETLVVQVTSLEHMPVVAQVAGGPPD